MKKILLYTIVIVMASSCSIYRKYQRPEDLPVDSLYRTEAAEAATEDTTSLGYIPWDEMFTDPHLQYLIRTGLEHNVDLQSAILRVEEAKAQLSAAKWAYAPSLNLTPQGGLSSIDGGKASWTYNAGGAVSWDIDLFGSLLNSKRGAQATLLQQQAYQQAVRSQIIGTIANTYYALLMLDGQVAISAENVKIWKEQVRTMEAMLRVGQTNESEPVCTRSLLCGPGKAAERDRELDMFSARSAVLPCRKRYPGRTVGTGGDNGVRPAPAAFQQAGRNTG